MDLNQCPCSGRSLARLLQPAVMAVLADESMHGYLIARRLRGMAMFRAHRPDPAGMYRLLRSMEEQGLLASSWDLADTGPARRRYELTESGRACLARWTETLTTYAASIDELLRVMKASG